MSIEVSALPPGSKMQNVHFDSQTTTVSSLTESKQFKLDCE
jgi:hypothetical protein